MDHYTTKKIIGEAVNSLQNFFKGKKILITGHTGFKGSWLCKALNMLGANLCGYSLSPTESGVFKLAKIEDYTEHHIGDIRDYDSLLKVFKSFQPDIIIHMAAQPLVKEGYAAPRYTYETNVMGTVNVLECIRKTGGANLLLNVTTDKVYEDKGHKAFTEKDRLNGFDPYANSKSCSELVTQCYYNSFFQNDKLALITARAGNVIGGGDCAADRIIPDCVRAAKSKKPIIIRNPHSIRPYQFVMEALLSYLIIIMNHYDKPGTLDSYNVGPEESDCEKTGALADIFCNIWGDGAHWINAFPVNAVKETNYLTLNIDKIKDSLSVKPVIDLKTAVNYTIEWEKQSTIEARRTVMEKQITPYLERIVHE